MTPADAAAAAKPPRRRGWTLLAVAAILVIIALLVLPGTGWLVAEQMRSLVQPPRAIATLLHDFGVQSYPAEAPGSVDLSALQRAAARYPNDYPTQLAVTFDARSPEPVVDRLRALARRFPDRPALVAHILRYATLREIGFHRDDDALLLGQKPGSDTFAASAPHPTPAQLAAYDAECALGERLDPDNAYFPLMRAIGLFADPVHARDADAQTAIQRGAAKPRWDDYIADEVEARWKLRREAFGPQNAMQQSVVMASALFPHYSRLRSVARVAVYKAMEAERDGYPAKGLAIRHAVMQCGARMRVQSGPVIGSLVGIALAGTATYRPGGAPYRKRPASVSADAWARQQADGYAAYLRGTGQPDEAAWAAGVLDAGVSVRDIAVRGIDLSPAAGRPFFVLIGLWIVDMVLLANALWMLVMGGVGAALARATMSQARWASVLLLSALGLFVLLVLAWSLSDWAEALLALWQVTGEMAGSHSPGGFPLGLARILAILATVALPLIVTLGLIIATAARRRPPASAARGMLPAAFVLLLVYGALAVATARVEAGNSAGLRQTLRGEGRYLAGLEGHAWPTAGG